jgi:hypothetical protein
MQGFHHYRDLGKSCLGSLPACGQPRHADEEPEIFVGVSLENAVYHGDTEARRRERQREKGLRA